MVVSHVLVALLAVAGWEVVRAVYAGEESGAAGQFARTAVVIAAFVAAIPLGAMLGAVTVSALTDSLAVGLLVATGALTVLAVVGLGLYVVAEGEVPAVLRRFSRTR